MQWAWSKNRYSPIGVDFGADSLKLLQVVPSDPPRLVAAARAEVPEHARTDPAARLAHFAQTLKSLLRLEPFKGRRAILSLPAYDTMVQHLQLSPADGQDLTEQVEMHLRQRLNIEPANMVVRNLAVGQVARDGGHKGEVICVAARRETVLRHIELARRAKLDVVGMAAEPLAILRAFAHLYRRSDDHQRTTCFIDLGAATTKVVIAHGAQMVFAKTVHVAGDHLTRRRAQASGATFAEARQARIAEAAGGATTSSAAAPANAAPTVFGGHRGAHQATGLTVLEAHPVQHHAPPPAKSAGGPSLSVPLDADTLDCLVDELQLSLRFHQSNFPNRPIEKLVFLGGEAHNLAICQTVARSLRIAAQLGDPLARLMRASAVKGPAGVDLRKPQPGWAVPLGLCLTEPDL